MGLAACLPRDPAPDTSLDADLSRPPLLDAIRLSCDVDAGAWTLELFTDAWSGGANLFWTPDGRYLERHPAISVEAAADGSADLLRATLAVVVAPTDVTPGARTALPCSARPTAIVWVDDLARIGSDCRVWGPDPAGLNGLAGVQACERPLEPGELLP